MAAVPVGQLLLLACLLTALYAPDRALVGVLPTRGSLRQLAGVLVDGTAEMREQATPALALTGLLALTTLFVGLIAVVGDLLAVAGRQARPRRRRAAGARLRPGDDDQRRHRADRARGTGDRLRAAAVGRPAPPAPGTERASAGALLGTGVVAALRTGVAALVAGIVIGAARPHPAGGLAGHGPRRRNGQLDGNGAGPRRRAAGSAHAAGAGTPAPAGHRGAGPRLPAGGRAGPVRRRERLVAEQPRRRDVDRRREPARTPAAGADRPAGDRRRSRCSSTTTASSRCRSRRSSVRLEDADPDDWRFDPATGTVFGRNVTTGELSYRVSAVEPRPSPALLAAAGPLLPFDDVQERFTDAAAPARGGDRPRGLADRRGRRPLRAGPAHPRLPDRPVQRVHLQPRHRARDQRGRPGRLPPAEAGLLRAVRRHDGGHGPGRRGARTGRPGLHARDRRSAAAPG